MDNVQAVSEFRGSFRQGEIASVILRLVEIDGTPFDPESVTYEVTENSTGNTAVSEASAEKVKSGAYVFEWDIPEDQDKGKYTLTWYYEIDGEEFTKTESIIVAEDVENSKLYSGRILLFRQSLELLIDCAQSIPVMFQEPKSSKDNQNFYWTKGLWNVVPDTTIYRNQNVITTGFKINYFKGLVTFDTPLTSHDVVNADYNFRWFSDEQLDRFLSNGIHKVNSFAPATFYALQNIPERYAVSVLYGAAVDALRTLMFCLNWQQPQQYFGGTEGAQQAFSQMDTLKKNYEETLMKLLEQKKFFPYRGLTKAVVVPEYTLPGGRSRWFRYLFSGSAL